MKAYFISGLGANCSVFDHIQLPEGYEKVYLEWLVPQKNETLDSYARRMGEVIENPQNSILIGLSLGGMVAIQVASIYRVPRVIMISSLRDQNDLKPYLQLGLKTRPDFWLPNLSFPVIRKLARTYMKVRSKSGIEKLDEMLHQTDMRFAKWAFRILRTHRYKPVPGLTLCHMVGNEDHLVKPWKADHSFIVNHAGHLMVFENAREINRLLKNYWLAPAF